MNLITSTYWQQNQNCTALLLQQYRYKATPLCLACVCQGRDHGQGHANAYLTEQLLQWFRSLNWRRLAARPQKQLAVLEQHLDEAIARIDEELTSCNLLSEGESVNLTGILCVDACFLLFHRGEQRIYLLNRAFGRGQLQCISDAIAAGHERMRNSKLLLRQGVLQQDVGLLIATASLCSHVTDQEIRECLYVEDVLDSKQADRHLLELGHGGERQGGRNQGAVLLLTRSGQMGEEEIYERS